MRFVAALGLVILPLTLGCAEADEPQAQAVDLEAERALLLETDRNAAEAYSTSDDPVGAILGSMTENVRILAPDMPMIEGKDASRAVWEELHAMPGFSLRYTPVMAEVGGGADLGYTIGTYHLTLPDEAGNIVAIDGKYLTEWRRQPDGAWKYEVDMFNADGPPVPVSEKEE